MPIYVYEIINEDESPGYQFEVRQNIHAKAMTEHPITGHQIRRVIQPPLIGGEYSDSTLKKSIENEDKIAKLGLAKYVKIDDGTYEKRAGQGPDIISADD